MPITLVPGQLDPGFSYVPGTKPIQVYQVPPEAEAFQQRRRRLGLGEAEAGRKVDLSANEIAQIERGELVPADPADWPALLRALGDDR